MTSNFPPFRAAPPKGEKLKDPPHGNHVSAQDVEAFKQANPATADLKPLAEEMERMMKAETGTLDPEDWKSERTAHGYPIPLDAPSEEAQHVEHVRCCAKCFSTEVVDAVKIGDAIYIKVS